MDRYLPADFFVLRTPLLPFEAVAALGTEPAEVRRRLAQLMSRPALRESIFLASPPLESSLEVWLADPRSRRGKKIERSLLRYFLRAAGRPTPFGLFAGCAIGSVAALDDSAPTRLTLSSSSAAHRHSRLSIDYLDRLCTALADSELASLRLRPFLTYRPNQTIYRSAGRLRLFTTRFVGGERSHHVIDLIEDAPLHTVLRRAATGALLSQLVAELLDRFEDTPPEDANSYVEVLIDSQVLVPDFGPILTGPPPFGTLLAQLARYLSRAPASARSPNAGPESSLSRLTSTLESVLLKLRALDSQEISVGVPSARYQQIVDELNTLPLPTPTSRLFQIDVIRPAAALSLGPRVVREVESATKILHRLMPASSEASSLQRFAQTFSLRYGDAAVPLLEALDEDAGIPFPIESSNTSADQNGAWGAREEFLIERIEAAQRRGFIEITLSEKDLAALAAMNEVPALPLPDALCARFSIAAATEDALSRGDFRLCVTRIQGPSGVNLISRFCHADPSLSEKIRHHLRAEERHHPDAIFAEIVHHPAGELGNVVLRPLLRDHEVPLLGRSGAPPESQLQLDDLYVAVVDDRVTLRSHRLGREVIPRLTTAADDDDARSLTVHRFLIALQGQGVSTEVSWQWGALSRLGFLPRVTHGRLVLSLARWRLHAADLTHLTTLRTDRHLPRFVALVEDRGELPIDLEDPLCVDLLRHALLRRGDATIVELFPSPAELCASSPDGHYIHEVILPLVRALDGPPAPSRSPLPLESARHRSLFLPGSEWLAIEITLSEAFSEELLDETIAPLIEQLLHSGAVDSWFFTRHSGDDAKLCVYLHGPDTELTAAITEWHQALAPLVELGRVFQLSFASYRRELDRFGGPSAIALAERLFFVDTEAVMEICRQLYDDEGEERRFRLALLGVDRLFDDLGLDLERKAQLVFEHRQRLRLRPSDVKKLGARYRHEQLELAAVLHPTEEPAMWLQAGRAILHQRSTAIAPIVDALRRLARHGELSRSIEDLAQHFASAFLSRLLRGDVKSAERRIYDNLSRLYQRRLRRDDVD